MSTTTTMIMMTLRLSQRKYIYENLRKTCLLGGRQLWRRGVISYKSSSLLVVVDRSRACCRRFSLFVVVVVADVIIVVVIVVVVVV
jgi:hypothetical protein